MIGRRRGSTFKVLLVLLCLTLLAVVYVVGLGSPSEHANILTDIDDKSKQG